MRDKVEETKVQKREKSLEMKVAGSEILDSQISEFRTTFLSLMTRKTSRWLRGSQ